MSIWGWDLVIAVHGQRGVLVECRGKPVASHVDDFRTPMCIEALCSLYGNRLVLLLFADLGAFALFQLCHVSGHSSTSPCPLSHARLRSTVTIESLHSNDLVLTMVVMPPRCFTQCVPYSSLSKCASLVSTTCLFVSSISPAKNTSSRIAYTYTRQPHLPQHISTILHIPCRS